MKKIYAFDFDGTLTKSDSFLAFIRYACGARAFWMGLLHYSPWLVLMKLRLYSNGRAKERVFSHFFKGMEIDVFDALCHAFAREHEHLLRPLALEAMAKARREGAEVLVVSASIDNWVKPFFTNAEVLGTQVEVKAGRLTGRFLTKNCYGREKVNRILENHPDRSNYVLIAFGDSRGDKEMLAFADEGHFKPFRV
jgi:HAD superfamily hydrolase (TIGR01490 family)